jgi:hypothetical protein
MNEPGICRDCGGEATEHLRREQVHRTRIAAVERETTALANARMAEEREREGRA